MGRRECDARCLGRGRAYREAFPELEAQGFAAILDRVYETGEPFVATEAPVVLDRGAAGREEAWYSFVYQPLAGDGVITARVASVEPVHAWTKAGVMIRQTLAAGAPHQSLFVTPGNGLAFQSRATTGATSVSNSRLGSGIESLYR